MRIILASASPRRRELLAQIGLEFEVIVSEVEENPSSAVPCELVRELAMQKAGAVVAAVRAETLRGIGDLTEAEAVQELLPEAVLATEVAREAETGPAREMETLLVVGADTVVSCEGEVLGKPRDARDAARMLRLLAGRSHEVYTGVALLRCVPGRPVESRCFYEATTVHFAPMTEAEIETYVSTGDPLDKAGAYGIQGFCARYITGIEGDYNNVVGLPVGRLYQEAKDWLGADPRDD